ncbi:amino acid/polyamine/organocation transporter (APC superfamily) [Ulvibacter sp. MAR_2010_11]|uniref:amino acid permease n=1 Tax=Ulvibacter sp. MAR_2010_11 TaxID=1250229 RepID=UPI000C2B65A2|nr:amino acid permease [Ulvibacter sp. MAR_2010_11]PKA82642.1 amino acid/polyamine/organocation transporter (APC superfamily) [Ulvibacter sp. MAR_2010_11]
MGKEPQKIGLITTTSLVVGNMIGVGIFVLPAALAAYGSISLLGWVFTAAGALILAKIFSNFSVLVVNKSGGPYTFVRAGFGDFLGFLIAWGYWISCWVSNGAIAIAIVGALSFFFPELTTSPILSVSLGLFFIWFFTWINSRGVKTSGQVQVVTTVLKILPLLFVILLGIFFFDIANFPKFNLTGESDFATVATVATLTLYAFLGIECATIPAENVENPEVTVPRATMYGTIITTSLYILGTIVLFGILPIDILKNSPAPFAEAANLIGGEYSGYFVAIGVIISGLGVLNGWILVTGQVPLATAKDNLFPRIFKRENKKGAPIFGLIIGSVLSSIVMLMNFTEGLVDQFTFIAEITVFSVLIPYVFTAAAYALVLIQKKLHANSWVKTFVLAGLGFAYSVWAVYGSGRDTVFYGFILLLLGVPFYIMMKWNQKNKL